mmetsp:Transcript_18280/g.37035  ORF Transcript_18280/g.37035 Transcript_18280/m.37035 type:complete len:316 (+) Transcript_18280:3348-4295(+)
MGAPDVFDEEEAVFWDIYLLPAERKEEVRGLRQFLLQGQAEWRNNGGVVVPELERDPRMGPVMQCVAAGLKRRPSDVIPKWADAREYVGTFWERSDFEALPPELLALVDECRELEAQQIASVRLHGQHRGSSISEEGCRQLGVPEELTREWVDGTWFDVDQAIPHYAKGPYANVYRDVETLVMACREFNKLLQWLVPVMCVAWIESRTTIVTKDAPLEPGGLKHRTCTDLTDSCLNDAVRLWLMTMPRLLDVIQKMGQGAFMAKQDLKDMFYSWKVHPKLWTFFGIRHPITGQSFVFPVLPMGFKLSPPIVCRNT